MFWFESYRLAFAYSPVRSASQLFKVYFCFLLSIEVPVEIHKCMEHFALGEF